MHTMMSFIHGVSQYLDDCIFLYFLITIKLFIRTWWYIFILILPSHNTIYNNAIERETSAIIQLLSLNKTQKQACNVK